MPEASSSGRTWRRAFVVAWIVFGALALAFLPLSAWLKQFSAFILSLGWIAPFAYIGAYILFCIFLIPSVALSLGVGPVFGFSKGLLLTVIASNIGGTVAFVLGRTVLRKRVERWASDKPKFNAMREITASAAMAIAMPPMRKASASVSISFLAASSITFFVSQLMYRNAAFSGNMPQNVPSANFQYGTRVMEST